MSRRLLPVIATGVLLAAWAGPSASMADDGPGLDSVVATGIGDDLNPVGIGFDRAGDVTTAFTAAGAAGTSLWVARRGARAAWRKPVQVAADVRAGSVDFAENRAGAAVLTWEVSRPGVTGSDLVASLRAVGSGGWSEPSVLASGGLGAPASVGIDPSGDPTVAYVREGPSGTDAFTRDYVDGVWRAPQSHGSGAVHRVAVAVATGGGSTLVWSQDETDGAPGVHVVRRDAPGASWTAPRRFDYRTNADSPLDLAVSEDNYASLSYHQTYVDGRQDMMAVVNEHPADTASFCTSECGRYWNQGWMDIGDHPALSALLTRKTDGRTLLAKSREVSSGGRTVELVDSNGSEWNHPVRLPDTDGDISDVRLAQGDADSFRVAERVAVSWVSHENGSDILRTRSVEDSVFGLKPEAGVHTLSMHVSGSALGVSPTGQTVAVWGDSSTSPGVLRSQVQEPAPPKNYEMEQDQMVVGGGTVAWPASPGASSYDVRRREATARRGLGRATLWKRRTATTHADFRSAPGRTSCFSSRWHSAQGEVSAWTGERCLTTPVDDRSLRGTGWRRVRSSGLYGEASLRAATAGRRLSMSRARARSVSLLVTRRPNGGRVQVRLGARSLGTFSTAGPSARKVIVHVVRFKHVRTGRLTLQVVGSHRPVEVDGVFLGAV